MKRIDPIRALYSTSTIVEIVFSFVFRSHDNHRSHQWLCGLIPKLLGSIGLAFRYLESCARFAGRYISRGRKRRPRTRTRTFPIDGSKIGADKSEVRELESGEDSSLSMDLPPDIMSSKSSSYQSRITQIPLANVIQADISTVAAASGYHATETTTCWSCAHPIRSTCTITVPSPSISHHIDHCAPYCHGCYFSCVCRRPRQKKCDCPAKVPVRLAMKLICESCSLQPLEEVICRREEREKRELALLAGQAMRCANCGLGLPTRGPRWWVCNLCVWECVDRCHSEG